MMKTLVLLIELGITIATFLLIFNMTAYAMTSYEQAQDSITNTVGQFQQNMPNSGAATGYIPAPANDILSGLMNFKI
jgi:hypothetical protein